MLPCESKNNIVSSSLISDIYKVREYVVPQQREPDTSRPDRLVDGRRGEYGIQLSLSFWRMAEFRGRAFLAKPLGCPAYGKKSRALLIPLKPQTQSVATMGKRAIVCALGDVDR